MSMCHSALEPSAPPLFLLGPRRAAAWAVCAGRVRRSARALGGAAVAPLLPWCLALAACGAADEAPVWQSENFSRQACAEAQPTAAAWRAGEPTVCMTTQYTDEMNDYASISAANHAAYARAHGYHYFRGRGRLSGPSFVNADGPNRIVKEGLFWQKLPAIEHAMNACYSSDATPVCAWVMWVDGDTLVTDFGTRLETVIERATGRAGGGQSAGRAGAAGGDVDVIFAREEAGFSSPRRSGRSAATRLNAGVYFVRNSPRGRVFLDALSSLYPLYKNEGLGDQPAVQDYVLRGEPGYVIDAPARAAVAALPEVNIRLAPQRMFNAFPYADMAEDNLARWLPGCFMAHFAGMGGVTRVTSMKQMIARQQLASSDDVDDGLVHLWEAP